MYTIDHWIDGGRVPSTSGRTGPVFNPATGQQQGQVGLASVAEVDAAVASAKAAFGTWRSSSLSRRAEILFAFRQQVYARRAEIANLVSQEHGKVPSDAAGELARGLENVEFACGIPQMLKGSYSEQVSGGVDVYSIKQPLGVVAGITPFNFPAMVPMWMFANAIATGNTFVLISPALRCFGAWRALCAAWPPAPPPPASRPCRLGRSGRRQWRLRVRAGRLAG